MLRNTALIDDREAAPTPKFQQESIKKHLDCPESTSKPTREAASSLQKGSVVPPIAQEQPLQVRPLTAKPGSVVSDKRLPHHLRHSQSQQSTPNTKRGRSKTPKGVCVIPPIAQRQPLQVRPLTAKPGSVVPHKRLPRHLHLSSLPEQDCPKLQVEEASDQRCPKSQHCPRFEDASETQEANKERQS
jgi:hypothetical protein